MRTIKNLPVPQDGNDAKFPHGQIRNEDNNVQGTPVVREIYGDVLYNIYKIISDTGIEFTETEDSETTQAQLFQALKRFSNETNDIIKTLSVSGNIISPNFDFDSLPQNYIFIGRMSDTILASESYTIKSTGEDSYIVGLDADVLASSYVLVILNSGGTRIISLQAQTSPLELDFLDVNFGTPLSCNNSQTLLFFKNGRIYNKIPQVFDVESIIQGNQSNSEIKVVDCVVLKNRLVCFTLDTSSLIYQAFSFKLDALGELEGEISMPVTESVDNQPYMFSDGQSLFFSNSKSEINEDVNPEAFVKCSFDEVALEISISSTFNLTSFGYEKTTNSFITPTEDGIYTFINGNLKLYDFANTGVQDLGFYEDVNGQVFSFNKKVYFSSGEIATKWSF